MTRKTFPDAPITGYAEGYYGRLLNWKDRSRLLQTLQLNGMTSWLYAPKEDACHRLYWREPWSEGWTRSFSRFCEEGLARGINVIAGVAPGLDFNFEALASKRSDSAPRDGQYGFGNDYDILLQKSRHLLSAGAAYLALLMDDIDPDFARRSGSFDSEGTAHAALANRLGDDLGICLLVVPRIYANELVIEDPDYLPDFSAELEPCHVISHCGQNVVSRVITPEDCEKHLVRNTHRVVVWDNLYANDYCPRRLFVGEWSGRDSLTDVLLNPTGMPCTDRLLLDLMAGRLSRAQSSGDTTAAIDDWQAIMRRHGVPEAFDQVAQHCWHPFCNDDEWTPQAPSGVSMTMLNEVLDRLLWRWKTELAREWYPYLMGLRQDLTRRAGELPDLRIRKTQTWAMASVVLDPDTTR